MDAKKNQLTLLTVGMTLPLLLLIAVGFFVDRLREKPPTMWQEVQLHITIAAIIFLVLGMFTANRLDIRHKFYYFQHRLLKSLILLDIAPLLGLLLFCFRNAR